MKNIVNNQHVQSSVTQILQGLVRDNQTSTEFSQKFKSDGNSAFQHYFELVHRREFTPGQDFELLDSQTAKIEGKSDFDKDRLDSNTIYTASSISLKIGTNAASGKEVDVTYGTTNEASINNAKIQFSVDNKVRATYKASSLLDPLSNDNGTDYFTPDVPLILIGGKPLNFKIIAPKGVTAPAGTDKYYAELSFRGIQAVAKV